MDKNQLKTYYTKNYERFKSEFYSFLRFKSISTDPDYSAECIDCAEWVKKQLADLGFTARLVDTPTKPIVLAHRKANGSKKHILFYGHYDVQPVDPLELWNSPPFEPTELNERVYARGALDDKGQVFYFLKGVEALVKNNLLNTDITILIEGEEECGSEGLKSVLPQLANELKADVLLVADTGMRQEGRPAITMGLRGIIALEVIVSGANKDLHSGVHGGLCRNPAFELTRLVAGLVDSQGKITIPGYYDNVRAVSERELNYLSKLPFDAAWYKNEVGIEANGGEQGLHPWVRNGFRPTIEVNGIVGGYTGSGGKTIIPSSASVKLSSRLVGGQDPERCLNLLKKYFQDKTPSDLTLSFGHQEVGGPAVLLSPEADCVEKAIVVLRDLHDCEPDLVWEGASIPIVSSLAKLTNGQALLVGYGLESDNIHAPNENFAWSRFEQGYLYAGRILQAFGA